MHHPFDFDKALRAFITGQILTEKNGNLTLINNQLTQWSQNLTLIWLLMWGQST